MLQVEPATCMPSACFCESIRDHHPLQPSNAWSSLGFCVIGILVLATAYSDRGTTTSRFTSRRAYSVVFAAALFLIGIGSFAFHATLTLRAQFADVFGMYLIATFVLIYALDRLKGFATVGIAGRYAALNALLAAILYLAPELRRYVFAIVLLAGLVVELYTRRVMGVTSVTKHLQRATAILGAGFVIWILDITRAVCSPDSWLQGHALWHICGAVGAWFLFLYYRSEKAGDKKPTVT